jgi:hypothetical protein
MATYGGAPSATGSGWVLSELLDKLGNILMLIVIFTLYAWIWFTWRRVRAVPKDPNFKPALYMLVAAAGGLPLQLIRITYGTTYAFELADSGLDPIMGIFATRFICLFVSQLGCTIAMFAGGLFGIRGKNSQSTIEGRSIEHAVELTSTREENSGQFHNGNYNRGKNKGT